MKSWIDKAKDKLNENEHTSQMLKNLQGVKEDIDNSQIVKNLTELKNDPFKAIQYPSLRRLICN